MSPQDIINQLEYKYREIGAGFRDLESYVVNLEPELPVPLDEAMVDYKRWVDALNELEEQISTEENEEEVELVDETEYHNGFDDLKIQRLYSS